jgi:DNA polymerase-1
MHLVIIDGYGFVFRAYHSIPPLTRPDGLDVGAIYGFTSMLMKVRQDMHATHMVVALDNGQQNFRHQLYPAYKAHRPPAPESLVPQFPIVPEAVAAMSIPSITLVGYEADDIIATLALRAHRDGAEVTIVSSDKDLMQLVRPGIRMYDPIKMRAIHDKEVEEKFGVPPAQVQDVLAMMGDSSDNIPGIPGIGPKTACDLIRQHGNLEAVLLNAPSMPASKRRDAIIAHAEEARLSKALVALAEDAPVAMTFADFALQAVDRERLQQFLQEHGFQSLIKRLPALIGAPQQAASTLTTLATLSDLSAWLDALMQRQPLPAWCSMQLTEAGELSLFAEGQGGIHFTGSIADITSLLTPLWQQPSILKWGYNIKEVMRHTGCNIQPQHDIMLLGYLTGNTFTAPPPLEQYASLGQELIGQLQQQGLCTLYHRAEQQLSHVLATMERHGICLDVAYLQQFSAELAEQLTQLEAEIHRLAGRNFLISSPKQLGEILFDELKLPGAKKTKTGAYNTGVDILEGLAEQGTTIAIQLLEWRQLAKIQSTYTSALIMQVSPETGRIHTRFAMTATNTGRLSSNNPNLQNIPIRTELGRKIRKAFVAAPGMQLISADYSQIELRILAQLAEVPALKDAFRHDQDIHALTASHVFHVPLEEVDSALRRQAKAVNFGIIYGISPFGLAKQLGVSREEAKDIIERYFATYPGIQTYMQGTISLAHAQGYVTTLLGRRCYLPLIRSQNFAERSFAERAAINAPIQGTAADLVKLAMIAVDAILSQQFPSAKMLLQVHDELVIEVPEALAERLSLKLKQVMENVVHWPIPLTVEVSTGKDWDQLG